MPKRNFILVLIINTVFLILWLTVATSRTVLAQGTDIENSVIINIYATPTPTPNPCGDGQSLDASGNCVTTSTGTTSTSTSTSTPTPTPTPAAGRVSTPFSIFGYGPVNSVLRIIGIGFSETVNIDTDGYFELDNPPLPTFFAYQRGHYYPELCFAAQDSKNTTSFPVCIPPLPMNLPTNRVGPVILPPTISLSRDTIVKNSTLTVSGVTTPDTNVSIYSYPKNRNNSVIYTTKSNSFGQYSFNMPTNAIDEWKVFAVTDYRGYPSPKSTTLTYYIKPLTYKVVEVYEDTLSQIRPKLLGLIIIVEILILSALIMINHKKKGKITSQK